MFELKMYQTSTLESFTRWLEALKAARGTSETQIERLKEAGIENVEELADQIRNYPRKTWQNLAENSEIAGSAGEYVDRTDDAGHPIPHICFKVPTGGGKTLLAAAALERLNRQRGLTLWIVPTRAIYEQTKSALWNKEHPYRKMLERASAGRVKMLEKDDPFNRDDVSNYLCVMMLMLPAANRRKGKEFLRMFKDNGNYASFFPDDDVFGDARMLNEYPDLECRLGSSVVKQSLFNVFKLLRPVVVLDEAHKAYGASNREVNEEFARSINRLDPQMVIELSATPNRGISNLLVDIGGLDLKKEEMIKLPVQITSFPNADWQFTLGQAVEELQKLDAEAQLFESRTDRYIRPIAVVRVERTGRDQRDGIRVHAEEVREYLMHNLGVPSETIRVKSAENDEIRGEDLLSDTSQVKWIITKSALMEGWDCPFAYLLVMLDNTQSQRAITQLVGRVIRQPFAQLTGHELLDQCYVYCNNTDVELAAQQVKMGLESEGLTGLEDEVMGGTGIPMQDELQKISVQRRDRFRGREIYLPVVLHKNGDDWIPLNYQEHILPHIDWFTIQPPDPEPAAAQSVRIQGMAVDVDESLPIVHPDQEPYIEKKVSIFNFTRRVSDIIPNLWQAARIVEEMIERLRADGKTEEYIYDRRSYLVHVLREHVKREVEDQSEQIFRDKLDSGAIRFDLEAGNPCYRLRESYEIEVSADARFFTRAYGQNLQLSLFEQVFEQHFDSEFEKKFAYYLDEERALQWWHRVAARQRGEYYLQGWKQQRIYPDFVAMAHAIGGTTRVLVFDTKGEHLAGNLDTVYKEKVLKTLEGVFNSAGRMTVHDAQTREGIFQLVFNEHQFSEISARLTGGER